MLKRYINTSYFATYGIIGDLGTHFAYIERTAHKLARTYFINMAIHGQGLEKKQMLLGRLVEIGTELFAMGCTVSYANKLYKKNTSDRSAIELADISVC